MVNNEVGYLEQQVKCDSCMSVWVGLNIQPFVSFALCLCDCNVMYVLCSLVVTCWERADLLALVYVVFCHFPKCILFHSRIKGESGAVKLV